VVQVEPVTGGRGRLPRAARELGGPSVVRVGLRLAAVGLRLAAVGLRQVAVAPQPVRAELQPAAEGLRLAAVAAQRVPAAQIRTAHLNPAAIGAAGLRSTMMPVALLATSARTGSILVSRDPA